MHKFAHMADCHIGAWRDEKLRNMNLRAFEKAIDVCIEEKVNFIIISGDLFDTNIPNLYYVKQAVEKLKFAKNKGIDIYMVYGSHDYSPNTISVIDVLESTELFEKASKGEYQDEKLELQFIVNNQTGAKITGLSGRKVGLEKEYFESLNAEKLEQEKGFKIFLFHTSITEMNPGYIPEGQSIPISMFPKGFDYYAGGNIHKKNVEKFKEYPIVIYPGPLFATDFRGLEDMARGEKRGFYISEFEDTIKDTKFFEVEISEVIYQSIDADDRTANQIEEKLLEKANALDLENKIVLFRVSGTMTSGRPVDIDFRRVKEITLDRGAVYTNINRYALQSKEKVKIKVKGERKSEIEERIFKERLHGFKIDPSIKSAKIRKFLKNKLMGKKGTELAHNLLDVLRVEKREGETNTDFRSRVLKGVLEVTQLEDKA